MRIIGLFMTIALLASAAQARTYRCLSEYGSYYVTYRAPGDFDLINFVIGWAVFRTCQPEADSATPSCVTTGFVNNEVAVSGYEDPELAKEIQAEGAALVARHEGATVAFDEGAQTLTVALKDEEPVPYVCED